MTTFTIIDRYSGFVWGTADAETPCEACRIIDETEAREYGRTYREVSRGEIGDSGYNVHEAPAGWTCDDGQDEAQIAVAQSFPLVAHVETAASLTINGRRVDADAAACLMDHDLREELHARLAPCDPQVFADTYCAAHRERFGEDFVVN